MHNPGMSPKAWEQFNKLMAQLNLKYADSFNQSKESEVIK